MGNSKLNTETPKEEINSHTQSPSASFEMCLQRSLSREPTEIKAIHNDLSDMLKLVSRIILNHVLQSNPSNLSPQSLEFNEHQFLKKKYN